MRPWLPRATPESAAKTTNVLRAAGEASSASRTRPREKLLVADRHFAVVERMLGEEIGGERDFFWVVVDGKVGGHDVGIVRTVEGEVSEERFGVRFLEERDRLIREGGAGVLG
jgi:hypothetical protein